MIINFYNIYKRKSIGYYEYITFATYLNQKYIYENNAIDI